MAKQIELLISQSGDPEGVLFTIYRSDQPGLSQEGPAIAVVDEASAWQRAFQVEGESLIQDPLNPFQWKTSRVYEESPRPILFLEGTALPDEDITTFPNSRVFLINQKYDLTNSTVTCNYTYLSSVVIDDNVTQSGVQYNGPVPNPLNAPIDYNQMFNTVISEMQLTWALDPTPHSFYYTIQAKDKNSGASALSGEQAISLTVTSKTISYVVERSEHQNGPWTEAATVKDTNFSDTNPTPFGHIPLQMTPTANQDGTVSVVLTNAWFNWEQNQRPSWYYRVHAINDEGLEGPVAPATPFYNGLNLKPVKYILRRKLDNGVPATVDGTDAITVATWTEDMIDSNNPTIDFVDSALPGNIYSYTSYVIDALGYIGQPYMSVIDNRLYEQNGGH